MNPGCEIWLAEEGLESGEGEGGVGIELQSAPKVHYSYNFSPGLRYHYLLHKSFVIFCHEHTV